MAVILSLNSANNDLQLTPSVNGIYTTCFSQVTGGLTNDDLIIDTILSIDVLDNTITASNLQIAGAPASFPYPLNSNQTVSFGFNLGPSGTIANTDTIKFTINCTSGSYEYTYDFLELDPMSAFNGTSDPIGLGTVYVGSTVYPAPISVDNQSCISFDFDFSTTLPDVTWLQPSPVNVVFRTTQSLSYSFSPTLPYGDLSGYSVTIDNGCINPSIFFSGQAIDAPVISGVSKIAIGNSISFM